MSILGALITVAVLIAAVVAYEVYKAKKPVTVANVVAQAKVDEAKVAADAAVVKSDVQKL